MNKILGFFGPYRFLSNFHKVPVVLDGETYPTTEHAYQAAKTFDLDARKVIRVLPEPRDARRAGQNLVMRPNWNEVKLLVMDDVNRQKFSIEPCKTWLLETEDWYLEETNTWNDTFWGVCNHVGANNLGKILMKIREDLRTIRV